jgi:hypothetical protein
MLRALERGLALSDFEILTPGMIIDFVITYNNEQSTDQNDAPENSKVRMATQADFDRF